MTKDGSHLEHLDDQTLELYVIQSPLVKARRAQIGRHLSQCDGCAALHKEIASYYAEVETIQQGQSSKEAHALYAPDRALRPRGVQEGGTLVEQKLGLPQRFFASWRQYPVRWSAGFVVVVSVLILFLPRVGTHDKNPSYTRSKDECLVVYNKEDQELWRKHIGAGYDLNTGTNWVGANHDRGLTTGDIDGDGKNEVLAVFGWMSAYIQPPLGNVMICYNSDGSEKWRYVYHKNLSLAGVSYSDDYRIHMMILGDFTHDGRPELIIGVSHNPWFPNFLVKLDPKDGSFISEYAHPGVVGNCINRDIDGDGVDELILSGQNNRLGRACLVVLDPRKIEGYAPAPREYIPEGSAPGSEKYYLVFPPSDLEPGWLDVTNQVTKMTTRADGTIEVVVQELIREFQPEVFFYLDSTMTCVRVKGSDHFTAAHKVLEKEGMVSRRVNDAFYERLQHQVQYWDGRKFVNKPTKVLRVNERAKK